MTTILEQFNEGKRQQLFDKVYQARQNFYEQHFGKLPNHIQKIGHLFGVWPSGGLFIIPATQLNAMGNGLWVYSSFGMSNADMPTSLAVREGSYQQVKNEFGQVIDEKTELIYKQPNVMPQGWAGYGHELLIVTRESADWALWVLQWAVGAELIHDVEFLDRVANNDGFTVEQVKIDYDRYANIFINLAEAPLPTHMNLPNGQARFLVITPISDAEMHYSFEHGRKALLEKLKAQGNWQIADLNRPSVV